MSNDFCCDTMRDSIKKDKIIEYDDVLREYDIRTSENTVRMLKFCPWCGNKLAEILNKEIFSVLENEYGIKKEEADIYNFTNVPKEFQSDEWWRKRGL